MFASLLLSAAIAAPGVAVAVHLDGDPVTRCEGKVVAERPDGTVAGEAEARERSASLTVSAPAPWTLRLVSDRCWAPAHRLDAGPAAVELRTWPAASLSGGIAIASNDEPPSHVDVSIESPPRTPAATRVPRTTLRCPVRGRKWSCPVPRVALDVRIGAGELVPHYFWDVTPDRDVGVLTFVHGASISGYVVDPRQERGAAGEPIEVTLHSERFTVTHQSDDRAAARSRAVTASPRGFFQFRGVSPGETYTVTARRPGRAPATVSDIRVERPIEHALERPLELGDLGALEWTITPPTSASGEPWAVSVHRRNAANSTLVAVRAPERLADNTWRASGLEPGEYRVAVADSKGATYHRQYRIVEGDVLRFDIRLSVVPVQGRVRLGDDPIEARLTFESEGRKVSMDGEAEGTFAGSLPEEGDWLVKVAPESAARSTVRRTVSVRRDEATGIAEIEIELPRTSVSGSVVDERGQPVPGASVELRRSGRYETNAETDASGAFALIGIDAGAVTLRAVAPDGESAVTPFTIAEDDDTEVKLVVRQRIAIRGVVVRRGGGPLAGVLIRHLGSTGQLLEEVTGPGGEFELQVPSGAAAVSIAVIAYGFPLKLQTLPVQKAPATVVMENRAGVLEIGVGEVPPWPSVRRDGYAFVLPMLFAPRNGGPPREMTERGFALEVEPGVYSVCVSVRECESVVVQANGSSRVDTNKNKKPEERRTTG